MDFDARQSKPDADPDARHAVADAKRNTNATDADADRDGTRDSDADTLEHADTLAVRNDDYTDAIRTGNHVDTFTIGDTDTKPDAIGKRTAPANAKPDAVAWSRVRQIAPNSRRCSQARGLNSALRRGRSRRRSFAKANARGFGQSTNGAIITTPRSILKRRECS
jgi:hypothetical protein